MMYLMLLANLCNHLVQNFDEAKLQGIDQLLILVSSYITLINFLVVGLIAFLLKRLVGKILPSFCLLNFYTIHAVANPN